MGDITLSQAQALVDAAQKKAAEIDTLMNIAVVDAGGNLKAFARMDGAWLGSIDISMRKARTARFFDMNTGDLGAASQPGGSLYNIEVSNGGLITFPGGIPLTLNGEVVGGIGVSGSSCGERSHRRGSRSHRTVLTKHSMRAEHVEARLVPFDRFRAHHMRSAIGYHDVGSCHDRTHWARSAGDRTRRGSAGGSAGSGDSRADAARLRGFA